MIQSFLYVLFLAAYFVGVVICPKQRDGRNGFSKLIAGGVLLIFLTGLAAAVYTFIGVPVNLMTIGLSIFMVDLLLLIPVFVHKRIAETVWPLCDAISLLVVFVFVGVMCYIKFGPTLNLTFGGVDPARYMRFSIELLRSGEASGEYLTDLINAMCIAVFQPFLKPVSYYRAFVLSDILIHFLSIGMFYILLAKFNRGKLKWVNTILTLLYFCGYQLHNLCSGTFMHWVDGVLIIMFLIFMVYLLEQEEVTQFEGIAGSILGIFGLLVCYPLFALIVAPMFLAELVIWCRNHLNKLSNKHKVILLAAATACTVGGIFFAMQRVDSLDRLLRNLSTEGVAYREPYMDFLFFLPVVITLAGLLLRHKKENRILLRLNAGMLVFMCAWFALMTEAHLSMYYYYRMYYVPWLLAWLMTGQTVYLLYKEKKLLGIASYGVFYAVVIAISVSGLNDRLYRLNDDLFDNNQHYRSLTPLYSMNYEVMTGEHNEVLNLGEFGIFDYVLEELSDETVPIMHSIYSALQAEWYRGITGVYHDNGRYDLSSYSIREAFQKFDKKGIRYFTILKGDVYYQRYKEKIFDRLETVYETDDGVIYTSPDKTWTSVVDGDDLLTSDEKKLFRQVRRNYKKDEVLLLCEPELSQKAEYYAIYTGVEIYESWEKYSPEGFLAATYLLNNDKTEYVSVLKDSEMYRLNRDYFDSQDIVFENRAGMIMRHAGSGWMPSEQGGTD